MDHWLRFSHNHEVAFGKLIGARIEVHRGDMFADAQPTGRSLALTEVTLLTPCVPGKMLGLWNNFRERAALEGWARPSHPLYFAKPATSFLAHGDAIRRPAGYDGQIVFEGELGVVIGRRCHGVGEDQALECIFGYTCVNDVTARDILKADPTFPQWTRAKGFDGFGPFGPVIATGLDPGDLRVRSLVDGVERQSYAVGDMFFAPHQIVSRLSHDMTLEPGDVIACGTSVGAGPIPPGCMVEIEIDGVGRLANRLLTN